MRRETLDLVDPVSRSALKLQPSNERPGGDILDGTLKSPRSRRAYILRGGIPRFVLTRDARQKQTEASFGFKWAQRSSYDSPAMHEVSQKWLVERYGFPNVKAMRGHFAGARRILDAGCGSGFSASLWMDPSWRAGGQAEWIGADISEAIDIAQDRVGKFPGTSFVQADLFQLPFKTKTFDIIFSEGVLHHTPSTKKAFQRLVPLLAPGGEIMFYVYRKKGPIREFTDDYLRSIWSKLKPQQAWERLVPLTKLGKSLASMRAQVVVEEDVQELGIKAGTYDIQRFIYWNFAKLFWNDSYKFEENQHLNFDWYHPAYAHRQTEEEVRQWCREARLSLIHFNTQDSGFTVRARTR